MSSNDQKMIEDFVEKKRTEEEKITLEFAKAILDCEIQKKEIAENIKDIKSEAKDRGVQVQQIMKVVKQLKDSLKESKTLKDDLSDLSDILMSDSDFKFKLEQLIR